MQHYTIHSDIDIGDGPIPRVNVVAPDGRGIYKPEGFNHLPDDTRAYLKKEYDDMRDIAAMLMERGIIKKGSPILYPEHGGIVAAQAVADVTGGTVYPMTKIGTRQLALSTAAKDAVADAKQIVVADDVIHTGNALRKAAAALKDYNADIAVVSNRMFKKSLYAHTMGPTGQPGGFIARYLPQQMRIYSGGIYTGRDIIKTSDVLKDAQAQGFTLESLHGSAGSETGPQSWTTRQRSSTRSQGNTDRTP